MPAAACPRRQPTDDWDQLRLLLTTPEQEAYALRVREQNVGLLRKGPVTFPGGGRHRGGRLGGERVDQRRPPPAVHAAHQARL